MVDYSAPAALSGPTGPERKRFVQATPRAPFPISQRGFTLLELSFVLLTVGLLILFGIMRLNEMRRLNTRNPLQCQQNLKWIGMALSEFQKDHGDKMPWQLSMKEGGSQEYVQSTQVAPHFRTLTNFIRNTRILTCPMDPIRNRKADLASMDDSALSYFLNVSARPDQKNAILTGDRTLSPSQDSTTGELKVESGQALQWTYPVPDEPGHVLLGSTEPTGNLLFSNGSLLETTTSQLQRVLQSSASHPLVFMLP